MRKTTISLAAGAALCAGAALFTIDCGGDAGPTCGNGVVESGEQCDDGAKNGTAGDACSSSCNSISIAKVQLNITWSLFAYLEPMPPGYQAPACSDFGATKIHLQLVGPTQTDGVDSFDTSLDCEKHSQGFPDPTLCMRDATGRCMPLPAGVYQATGTLLRDDGLAVSNAVSTTKISARPSLGAPVILPIDFEPGDILNPQLTGTFKFHVGWGAMGVKCADAKVTKESIVMLDGTGHPVLTMTKDGTRLDGTPGNCYTPMIVNGVLQPQEIDNLTWGRYSIAVYSPDAGFCAMQPLFVNPGQNPVTYDLVAMVAPPRPDGGVGDGGAPDAGGSADGGAQVASCQ